MLCMGGGGGSGKRSYFKDITLIVYDACNNSLLPVDVSVWVGVYILYASGRTSVSVYD